MKEQVGPTEATKSFAARSREISPFVGDTLRTPAKKLAISPEILFVVVAAANGGFLFTYWSVSSIAA
jgi:hypothetical protein